jgi:phosphoglycerol transferase MdoB-like AlkP superfamily enzyme
MAVVCVWAAYILVHQSLLAPEMDFSNQLQILVWFIKSLIFGSFPASLVLAGALLGKKDRPLPPAVLIGIGIGVTCYFSALFSVNVYFHYFGDLPYPGMLIHRWRETWSVRTQIVAQLIQWKEVVLLLLWLISLISMAFASAGRRFPSRPLILRFVCLVLVVNIGFNIYKGVKSDITEDIKFGHINLAQTRGLGFAYGLMVYEAVFGDHPDRPSPPYPGKINEHASTGFESLPGHTNVIVLQVESLDMSILGMHVSDRPVTPFLNDLKSLSIFFSNFIAQHSGGGTSDCEWSVLTSLLPSRKGSGFRTAQFDKIRSLPATLGENGYVNAVFHSNYASYFHRAEAFPRLGFHHYFHDSYFTSRAKGMYAKDKPFLEQSVDKIKTLPRPFYAHLITIQSHGPFGNITDTAFRDFVKTAKPDAPEILIDYLTVMHEVDDALRHFFNLLKDLNMTDNCLIILFSDHVSGVLDQKTSYERIPLLLIHSSFRPDDIPTPCSHLDIAPTITALLGLEEPGGWLGTALLPPDPDRVVVLNGPIRIHLGNGRLIASHSPEDFPFIDYSNYLLGK